MQQNVENTTTAPVVPAPRGGKPVFRSRRMRIRFYSYIIAIFAVVAGFAAMGWYQAYAMRMRIEYSYQRALNDLELYVGNIDVALQKSLYAGTPEQAVTMSAKVWREAGAAKACLASLPYTDTRLSNTQKFLSQVGEFAYSLSRRVWGSRRRHHRGGAQYPQAAFRLRQHPDRGAGADDERGGGGGLFHGRHQR